MKKIIPLLFATAILCPACNPTSTAYYVFDEAVTNQNGSAYYEIFVASYYDMNNDNIGDLNGVAAKLPYLQDLGVKGLWLMPIHPSDSYHKYDVKDYKGIDPSYGTLSDFNHLIESADERNIDIIIDLIINHSSSNHPWFIEAQQQKRDNVCSAADSKCNYYNWSSNQTSGYAWSPIANAYYEARFSSSMPDLNLDNPFVRQEFEEIATFWLNRGVKGFRLDAVTSFYTGHASANIAYLTYFNNYVKSVNSEAFIIGEAWETFSSTFYSYASSGMNFFNFPLSELNNKSIASSVKAMRGIDFANALVSSEVQLKQVSDTAKNALIISNHDMDRSAGYLPGNLGKMAASAYLLSPGYPFIYYGEEIGLKGSRGGSNSDANRRLAMIWDKDDDSGKCANPEGTDYDSQYQVTNGAYDNLEENTSLTSHYKKVLNVRNKYGIIHDGLYESVDTGLPEIAMFKVSKDGEELYIVHNFSNQAATFNLAVTGLSIDEEIDSVGVKPKLSGLSLTLAEYSSVILK
ncbi:MAG: alpha-amylase family glycosyl hydrolase [Bacilli bacterium]|jgi:glycosidase